MKQIGIKAYYFLFIYNFFFKYFVNGACAPRFSAISGSSETCYNSVDECHDNGYYYYNSFELKCWKDNCPGDHYMNERKSNNEPSEDLSRNTCVKQCGQNFPKYRGSIKTCLKNCDIDEGYTIDQPNLCQKIKDINKNTYKYVSEKDLNLYLKECHFEKFIYTNNDGKKICVSNCSEYGQWHAVGKQDCLTDCNSYSHYDQNSRLCLNDCLDNKDINTIYSKSSIKSCLNISQIGANEVYYTSNKVFFNKDNCLFIDYSNRTICLPQCNGNVQDRGDGKYYCNAPCDGKSYYESRNDITQKVCVESCNLIIHNGNRQCISACPKNYVQYGRECYNTVCENSQKFLESSLACSNRPTNYYYILKQIGNAASNKVTTYVWVDHCTSPNQYIKDADDPECVSVCPDGNNYIKGSTQDIQCLKSCGNEYYIEDNSKYYCKGTSCPSGYYTFYENGVARKKCSQTGIDPYFNCRVSATEDYKRYSSCNGYYLKNGEYKMCKTTNPCTGNDNYYFEGECLTGSQCIGKNKFYVENKICVDKCTTNNFKYKTTGNIYICQTGCNGKYIDSGNYCVDVCPQGKNFIGKNNYCKSQCNSTDGIHFYFHSNEDTYLIYKCIDKCSNSPNHKYEGYNTNECFESCSGNLPFFYIDNTISRCYDNCLNAPVKFTFANTCIGSCNQTKQFYYEKEKICLNQCNSEDFAYSSNDSFPFECIRDCKEKRKKICQKCLYDGKPNVNICVSTCYGRSDKPYTDGDECVDICPNIKRFFDGSNNICLTDCPTTKKKYVMDDNTPVARLYECKSSCPNNYMEIYKTDTILNAILCIKTCPDKESRYYTNYINYRYKLSNQCYAVCPTSNPFHLDEDGAQCQISCQDKGKYYHEINDTICKDETKCFYKYIDFENKLCLQKDLNACPSDKKYITYPKDSQLNNKIICSNSCNYNYGSSRYNLTTPYNICVKACSDISPLMEQKSPNDFGTSCFCTNLYYINNSMQVECFQDTTNNLCKMVSNIYRINLNGTKECIKTCNGSRVLSLKEDYCYDQSYTCNQPNDKNTQNITKNNGQRQCDCKFRFYYEKDPDNPLDQKIVKKCLDDGVKCHAANKNKYVPETKECADECPKDFKHEFQNYFCLKACPKDSIEEVDGNIIKCKCVPPKKYWHKISSGNFECLDTCHDKYPVYAPYNNRCLKQCKDSYFPIFHEYKCYRSCDGDPTPNIVNGKAINENGGDLYQQICKCESGYTWYKHENNTIFCSYRKTDCKSFTNPPRKFKYKIFDTNQCVDECPNDYPYIFNEGCFKNCSHAAKIYNYANYSGIFECQCTNLWINVTRGDVNLKECINPSINECYVYSNTLKYKINTTNECVDKCPDEMYEINYTCYENCPEYTKDNERDKKCSCNTNMGYWYEFKRNYNGEELSFLECGEYKCPYNIYHKSNKINPDTRQYLLKTEKKCLYNCSENEEYEFNYKNICIKECPYYTYTEHGNNCTLFNLDDTKITNREELKGATEVQALELYYNVTKTKNEYKDEFFFKNKRYNVSIHIYGIDRNNSYKDKVDFSSDKYKDLTYIDFGTCINKLYLDKNISEDEQILLVKYDILNETSYMINRVEYELVSNNTNEKLDALVCDPYEILVSYPLSLDRFNVIVGTENNNEYLIKFNIGKALYEEDDTINTFDYNNYVYKNFCRGLEYNGKDIVFEDRYKILFPNNVLLCENNCTINNTDFDNQRVNCLCTYKRDFDFNREEHVDDIFNNPNFYIPTQSPANAEAMKCLFNFTAQQAIAKNFAFYYCFAITAVEIALSVVSSIIGINSITNFMKPILNKIQNQDFKKKSKPKKTIGFKTDNIISSTNRPINNPPKRNNINSEDDEEIDSEEVKNNNNTNFENDLDSNDNKDANYEINIKKSNNKIPKNDKHYKAEYIPQEYNSKFFYPTDKGVFKKIDRNKLPFKIGKDTRILVEKRKDIEYESNYLEGQYSPNQNILIITDEINTDITNIVKYIKTEKLSDNKLSTKNDFKSGDNKQFGNTHYSKYTEKDLITVKKLKSNFAKPKFEEDGISELFDEDSDDMKVDGDNAGLFTLIRREQLFLRLDYKKYLEKKHPNNLAIFIAEILDKIYLVKIILFLRKYDIFTHQLSLYLFCHVLLMSLLCGFFTIRVIKKIWNQDGYPGIGFYLLYGLISHIIIWIIYQIFLYILDFRDKIKEIVLLQKELKLQESYDYDDNIDERNDKIFRKKYSQIISHIKCTVIIFYIIIFIIIAFCSIYLICFFALYTGTRNRVIKSYFFSIIEILIIKFVYGFSLASLRVASRINKMKKVYKVVYIFDKYIS